MTKGDFIHNGWPGSAATEMTQIKIKISSNPSFPQLQGSRLMPLCSLQEHPVPSRAGICWDSKGSRFAGQRAQSRGCSPWHSWQLCSSLENIWKRFGAHCWDVFAHLSLAGRPLLGKGGSKSSFSMFAALGCCSLSGISPKLPPHPGGV